MDIVKRYLRLNSRISFCSLSLGILLFLWGFALAIDLTMREPTMLIMFITVPFAGLPILFNVGILLDTRKDIKKIDEIIIDLENKYNMLAARACVEMYNEIMQRVHGGTSKGQESATVLKSRLFDESYQSSQS